MTIAYFDCFAGISGDMILGALLDMGVSIETLSEELKKIDIGGYKLKSWKVKRSEIAGTRFDIITEKTPNCYVKYKEIKILIEKSGLSEPIKSDSIRIFNKIAEAESKIHNVYIDNVHFHEIGAIDSIVDIVGSVIGIKILNVDKIVSSPLNTGSGTISSKHGLLPVPAPATAELLKGVPCYSQGPETELTTPTGASIITSLATNFGDPPFYKISKIGYGAGKNEHKNFPNLLRIIVGHKEQAQETLIMLETNIDDMNSEFYEHIIEKGLSLGALDIFLTPIIMKKGRPANKISILTNKEKIEQFKDFLFQETTSFGLRVSEIKRIALDRELVEIRTKFGIIGVKVSKKGNRDITVSPEYDDCKKAAEKNKVSLKKVYEETKFNYYKTHNDVSC